MSLPRVPSARQAPSHAPSHAPSAEPFDAIPLSVQQSPGLSGNAKRLYGALCSAQRMGWQPTYRELADRLAASPRSVVRWMAQLAAAGLVAVKRRGQGLPNLVRVLALVTVRSAKRAWSTVTGGHPPTRTGSSAQKKDGKKEIPAGYTHPFYGRAAVHLPGGDGATP